MQGGPKEFARVPDRYRQNHCPAASGARPDSGGDIESGATCAWSRTSARPTAQVAKYGKRQRRGRNGGAAHPEVRTAPSNRL